MRFRSVAIGQTVTWIAMSVAWILLSGIRLFRPIVPHSTFVRALDLIATVSWCMILVLWVLQFFFGRIEFDDNQLRLRGIMRSTRIPYEQIVGIRPAFNSLGKPIPKRIELETAPTSARTYPHDYLVIAVSDPSAVMHAIHDKVPTADYEPAG